MDFITSIDIKKLPDPITYQDGIFLIGSCFTEHIGNALADLKFRTLQNPHGILFDPASVCNSLISYIENRKYQVQDLFLLNEVWQSWEHHGRFSSMNAAEVIARINQSQQEAHKWLKEADWLLITLGSAFSYRLSEKSARKTNQPTEKAVANCHRAPGDWFSKHLLTIEEIVTQLDGCYYRLKQFNPKLNILFTVSPVRHLRDGVIDNNRSKARLIESVHHLVNKFSGCHYFPAYELVIDVLRDYRFYDIDLAHPNYAATTYVLDKFMEACIEPSTKDVVQEIKKINIARKHKPFQPDTEAHRQFLLAHFEKVMALQKAQPALNFEEELDYFKSGQPGK